MKKPSLVTHTWNSSAGEAEIAGSLELTDDQPCLFDELPVIENPYLKKIKMDGS